MATQYKVLARHVFGEQTEPMWIPPDVDPPPVVEAEPCVVAWVEVEGTFESYSSDGAVKLAITQEYRADRKLGDAYVAIPVRSFDPVQPEVEPEPSITLRRAAQPAEATA